VRLGAAYDDPLARAVDDTEVHVGVILVGRPLAAVAFDVGDGRRCQKLLALEALDELRGARVVVRGVGSVDVVGDDEQRLQLVAADAIVAVGIAIVTAIYRAGRDARAS
jgi:hypothetical protein